MPQRAFIRLSELEAVVQSFKVHFHRNWFGFWFGLCCLMTPGLSKDIRCHVWLHFFWTCNSPDQTSGHTQSGLSAWWLHKITSIFLGGFVFVCMVNILTLSPLRVPQKLNQARKGCEQSLPWLIYLYLYFHKANFMRFKSTLYVIMKNSPESVAVVQSSCVPASLSLSCRWWQQSETNPSQDSSQSGHL